MTNDARARELRGALTDHIAREFRPSRPVLEAIGRIPRHAFIPDIELERAYIGDAVVTRRDQTGRSISSISQPSLIAQMLDMLNLRPGLRVLEIGAGTGYNAALLAELVGPTGAVTTIDLDPEITDEAHRNLDATGYGRVRVTCSDGALGEPGGAPWDRIIVSTGAWEPAPEWITQLAADGKLVLPLAVRKIQRIVAFEPTSYGLRSTGVLCGGFLAQRGRDAGPRITLAVDDEIAIESEHDLGFEAVAARNLLEAEPVTVWTGVELPYPGRFDRIIVYLALHYEGLFTMTAPRTFLPGALRAWNTVYGVAHDSTLGHLALRASDPADPKTGNEVGVCSYGPEAAALADKLADDVRDWGRIPEADPILEVYPKPHSLDPDHSGAVVLDKRHSRIRVTWPDPPASDQTGPSRAPAVHGMRLLGEYMELLEQGKKSIEVRANDEKRQHVLPGDRIRFECGDRALVTEVTAVRRYRTFEELYEHEDAALINAGTSKEEQLAGIKRLYSEKQHLGAVAISVRSVGQDRRSTQTRSAL